jgi:hypothetical protein
MSSFNREQSATMKEAIARRSHMRRRHMSIKRKLAMVQSLIRPASAIVALCLLVGVFLEPWFGIALPPFEYLAALITLLGIHHITRSVERCKGKS